MSADKKDITFDATKMNDIADKLEHDLNRYAGLVHNLSDPMSGTDLTTKDLGDWDVARDMALAAHKGHQATTQYLQEFLQQYQNVINAIRKSAGNYSQAEDQNTTLASQAGPSGTPATDQTSTFG